MMFMILLCLWIISLYSHYNHPQIVFFHWTQALFWPLQLSSHQALKAALTGGETLWIIVCFNS